MAYFPDSPIYPLNASNRALAALQELPRPGVGLNNRVDLAFRLHIIAEHSLYAYESIAIPDLSPMVEAMSTKVGFLNQFGIVRGR